MESLIAVACQFDLPTDIVGVIWDALTNLPITFAYSHMAITRGEWDILAVNNQSTNIYGIFCKAKYYYNPNIFTLTDRLIHISGNPLFIRPMCTQDFVVYVPSIKYNEICYIEYNEMCHVERNIYLPGSCQKIGNIALNNITGVKIALI